MSIQIKLKNSVVQDSTPSASDLPEVGELAVNGNINSIGGFMRASDNTIVKIFGPGSVTTPTATTTVSGISELATNTETTTGTATNRVVTPAGLNAVTVAERTTSNTNYVAKAGSTMTGVLTATAGSNSAPAINFGDSDSGIFGGTNTVSLTAGGTTRLTADTGVSVVGTLAVTGAITSTSDLTIADKIIHAGDTDTAVRFPAANTVSVETGGSEALRVDSSGRLLVGTSNARADTNGFASFFQIEGTGFADSSQIICRNQANNAGANLILQKSRGSTLSSQTILQNNDTVGSVVFEGSDGTNTDPIASILAAVDGTPGTNDMPGRLVFSTTADGAVSPTERLRIDSAGLATFAGNITSNGTITSQDITIADQQPRLNFVDNAGSPNDPDYLFQVDGGTFLLHDSTNVADRFSIAANGTLRSHNNHDFSAGIDVTGAITGTGDMTIDTNTLHVDSSNDRVGIGTASPSSKLHVKGGDAYITLEGGSSNSNAGILFKDSSGTQNSVILYDFDNDFLKITGTNDTERMRIDSSGNVGIGVASPSNLLHVRQDINATGSGTAILQIENIRPNTGTGAAAIAFRTNEITSGNSYLRAQIAAEYDGASNVSGRLLFHTVNSSGSFQEVMRLDDSGQVGIGVTPDTWSTGAGITVGTSQGTLWGAGDQINLSGNAYFNSGWKAAASKAGASQIEQALGNIDFKVSGSVTADSAITFTNAMRINSSGNVGIGTTSPNEKLVVQGNSSVTGALFITSNTSTPSAGAFLYRPASNTLALGSNSAERMRIDSSGRVGIGMSNHNSYNSVADDLIIAQESGHCGITIRSGTTHLGGIFFTDTADTGFRGGVRYDHNGDYMRIDTNLNERVRIDHLGKLLLGITASNDTSEMLLVASAGTGDHCGMGIKTNNNVHDGYYAFHDSDASFRGSTRYDHSVDAMFFTTNGSNERMRINNSGQVLVGTSSNNNVSARLVSAVGSVPAYYANPAGLSVTTGNNANAHCVEFFQGRFDKRVLTLSSNYDQSVTFQVFEQADVNVGIITGNGSTTNFNTNPSDVSLKKNFESWDENVLSLFKNINPQKFNYLQENDGDKKSKGFIAQEMVDSFPEAYPLVENEDNKHYFNPSGMVVYLMKAIQELEAKVAALEAA